MNTEITDLTHLGVNLPARVSAYLTELERCTPDTICPLFTEEADIYSPFLDWMKPRPFFAKLQEASGPGSITLIDICVSATGQPRATGYFNYDWVLRDGSKVPFQCVDVFEFNAAGLITKMIIVYDTHPIRESVGDKYAHD